MSYDFKRLSDVESINSIPDNAEVFCVVDGEVKKVSQSAIKGGGGSDPIMIDSSIESMVSIFEEEEPIMFETSGDFLAHLEQLCECQDWRIIKKMIGNYIWAFSISEDTEEGVATYYPGSGFDASAEDGKGCGYIIFYLGGIATIELNINNGYPCIETEMPDDIVFAEEDMGCGYMRLDKYTEKTGVVGVSFDEYDMPTQEYIVFDDEVFNDIFEKYINGASIMIRYPNPYFIIENASYMHSRGSMEYTAAGEMPVIELYDNLAQDYASLNDLAYGLYSIINTASGSDVMSFDEFRDTIDENDGDGGDGVFLPLHYGRGYNITLMPQSLADEWEVNYGLFELFGGMA